MSHTGDGVTQDRERSLEAHWKDSNAHRFVSKATDKCLPFFKILKQAFVWMDECEKASRNLGNT